MIGEFGTDDVFIRVEGLIPRPSGAKQGVLNPTAIPYENTIPCHKVAYCSAAGLTPFTHYKKGRVRKSLVKDLDDFKRDYVDIYWLHLPTDIKDHLHGIKVPQVAMAFCANKGVIPMCGCRKPEQVRTLSEAVKIKLNPEEIKQLEEMADCANVKIMGADIFRPFVLKEKNAMNLQ